MALTPGTRLGVYDITAPIGEGGMGQVYRATDTKLKRQVAIKILPPSVAADPDRLARFQREAEVLASLNHPNIAHIHGLEESGGVSALVMELVEGEDLSQRIGRGAIPIGEALPIARQIAEALAAAHDQGIIHRDLKPANIKVRPDGAVKVLDFGLAKAMEPTGAMAPSVSISPTITTPAMTQAGMILGTAAYMSPEQARGSAVDKRADVWAFGCVLYEMLTGERPFEGASVTETLAAVLTKEPTWDHVPLRARRLLRDCLEKDPRRRLRDIGDAFRLLEAPPPPVPVSPQVAPMVAWALAVGLALAFALAIALWAPWRSETPARLTLTADIALGAEVDLSTVGYNMILAPDASRLVIVSRGSDGTRRLFRRNLDTSRAEPLPGTEGAFLPFFSPDGRSVGFFADGKLKKTSVDGGEVTTLCDAPAGRGGTWSENGTIVAALDTRVGLSMIPAAGGSATRLTELNPERQEASHRLPHFIPGGRTVVFSASADPANFRSADVAVVSLTDRRMKIVLEGVGSGGRYIASGHLVYLNAGRLFAVPFDTDRLEVHGNPVAVLEGVSTSPGTGAAQLDVALNGHLVYQSGPGQLVVALVWVDETGKTEPMLPEPADYNYPALSPDGSLLALNTGEDIWVYDWQQGRRTRLTTGHTRNNNVPLWTPDGRYVVFRATGGIFWTRADGARQPQPLIQNKNFLSPLALTPDGKNLAYSENSGTGVDLIIAPLKNDSAGLTAGKPEHYLTMPSANTLAAFSPDGHWLAYASAKSGIYEVYVRAFPDTGSERLISSGGHMPVWSRNGRELFYRTEDGRIMVVTYAAKGDAFVAGKPRLWSTRRLVNSGLDRNFDLAPDGKRFVASMPVEGREIANHALLVVNFFDEVRRRLAMGR